MCILFHYVLKRYNCVLWKLFCNTPLNIILYQCIIIIYWLFITLSIYKRSPHFVSLISGHPLVSATVSWLCLISNQGICVSWSLLLVSREIQWAGIGAEDTVSHLTHLEKKVVLWWVPQLYSFFASFRTTAILLLQVTFECFLWFFTMKNLFQ